MNSTEAIKRFSNPDGCLINFLNLGNIKPNLVPHCMEGLAMYIILQEITADNVVGKASISRPADLSSCTAFHILGKAGVWSLPHWDHHGVITMATCEEGQKAWITWPDLEEDVAQRWAESSSPKPEGTPFMILMKEGDVLIQPPRRVHALYPITDVLMSVTMHWD